MRRESDNDFSGEIERHGRLKRYRRQLILDNPALLQAILAGGQFGGQYSPSIANRMYSRSNSAAIEDACENTVVEQHGEGVYLIRMPIVNVVALDTDDGIVLIDTGYGPGGQALLAAVESIGSKPVHTIVLTHFHCDHAFGAWALFEAGHNPEIVSTAAFVTELQADIDTPGLNARYTNQHPGDVPKRWETYYTPTQTFHDKLTLSVGGLDLVLTHARAETADQLWVWVPKRSTVVSADYYQPFLPNAGNGKRRQRHLREWADALESMADLGPDTLLPMHGSAVIGTAQIQDRLRAHAEILNSIVDQVLLGLNAGLPRRDVADRVVLDSEHLGRDDVAESYGKVRDLAMMVANQYTGWWDGQPSRWSPQSSIAEATEVAHLAGGARALAERATDLRQEDIKLACQLVDWAFLADPDDASVRDAVVATYVARIEHGGVPTQEALVYLDHMAEVRAHLD